MMTITITITITIINTSGGDLSIYLAIIHEMWNEGCVLVEIDPTPLSPCYNRGFLILQ